MTAVASKAPLGKTWSIPYGSGQRPRSRAVRSCAATAALIHRIALAASCRFSASNWRCSTVISSINCCVLTPKKLSDCPDAASSRAQPRPVATTGSPLHCSTSSCEGAATSTTFGRVMTTAECSPRRRRNGFARTDGSSSGKTSDSSSRPTSKLVEARRASRKTREGRALRGVSPDCAGSENCASLCGPNLFRLMTITGAATSSGTD